MSELKAFVAKRLGTAQFHVTRDLEAMSPEDLARDFGGCSRTGFDIAFELALTTRLFSAVVRGEPLDAPRPDGWVKAPADYRDKEQAIADVRDAFQTMIDSLNACPDADLGESTMTPLGPMTRAEVAMICAYHGGYHSGQLNYMQTLAGDAEMHWM